MLELSETKTIQLNLLLDELLDHFSSQAAIEIDDYGCILPNQEAYFMNQIQEVKRFTDKENFKC